MPTPAELFERERPRLTALAYRMCGSWADAEDVVQQVAIEWWGSSQEVDSAEGWLTTVTVRRAIDALRARQRDAAYIGPWVPEPLVEAAGPQDAVEHAETLTTAFLMLAESLTPPQRAVIVLRSLDYGHAEIGQMLDITTSASRQHQVRGMRRLAEVNDRPMERDASVRGVDRQAAVLLQAFLSATREGDLVTLTGLLHEQVRAYNDGGGRTRAARRVVAGASNVARFTIGVAARHGSQRVVRLATVNGTPGAVVTLSGTPHVLSLQIRDGRIYRIFDVCNPDKHGTLRHAEQRVPVG